MAFDSLSPADVERRHFEVIAQLERKIEGNPGTKTLRNSLADEIKSLATFYSTTYPERVIAAMRGTACEFISAPSAVL